MRIKFTIIYIFLLLFSKYNKGQPYGLAFLGNGSIQEQRTGLDLSQDGALCLNRDFELLFDISFIPGHSEYFGYVFRIIENDQRNIDLIYDARFEENKHFKLIIGDKISDITFDIPIHELFKQWHTLKLKFDRSKNQMQMYTEGKVYTQDFKLSKNSCFKILFGVNNYGGFKVTDVTAMRVRDIKITEDKGGSYHWPLAEINGVNVPEVLKGKNGVVTNPLWIKKMHYEWETQASFKLKGAASVTFDKNSEKVYLIGADSLITYSANDRDLQYISYNSGKYNLMPGNQSFYDTDNNQLLNFYIDQNLISYFDFDKKTWNKNYIVPAEPTNYWHPNKFYSTVDSGFYIVGGYGQFTYHKDVFKYNLYDNKLEKINTRGDFVPRYLSALGIVKNGAYILGGYGSITGQQVANPKNLYDLTYFDIKKRTFSKVLELHKTGNDFAFANSMIINEKKRKYYALIFPNYTYNSNLQLIEGSLDSASFKKLGNQIPYTFYDINSFADLFYCEKSEKFIAVTLFYDPKNNNTSINIFSLNSPAIAINQSLKTRAHIKLWLFVVFSVSVLFISIFILYRNTKKKLLLHNKAEEENNNSEIIEKIVVYEQANKTQHTVLCKNAIYLFGDLQIFDEEGNDITRCFTPLLRELFLVILLHSIRGQGISSEKLTEILWFDKSPESARNNRSVNIAKLKSILEKVQGCDVSKKTGYWKIELDESKVFIDYLDCLKVVNSRGGLDREKAIKLAEITQRGGFLFNVEYEWLDSFKSDISNEVVDAYSQFMETVNVLDDPDFLIKIAGYISHFDPVNEEAMMIKCKALVFLGKHSLAKTTYENFKKEYNSIYGEEYNLDFQAVLDE